jgi:hypothetical protein
MADPRKLSQTQVNASFQAEVDRLAMERIWCPLGKTLETCPRFRKKCDGINCAAGFSSAERAAVVGASKP